MSLICVVDMPFSVVLWKVKKRGRGTLLVAVSLNKAQEPLSAKMIILENPKDKLVSEAISEMIDIGSTIRSDAHKTLANLSNIIMKLLWQAKIK